jgi:F0F1-type ATP synthase delta subunit
MVLVDRDRINVLNAIINNYLELVYETASIKMIEVSTASEFTNSQKEYFNPKIKRINRRTRNSISRYS